MEELKEKSSYGYISAIHSSLIEVKGIHTKARLHDLIKISKHNILGQIIQIYNDRLVVQCFEDTTNITLDEKVKYLHTPLSMALAPGLIAHVFDGIQRPLEATFEKFKDGELRKGVNIPPLSRIKKWHFVPKKKLNAKVITGDIIGTVKESDFVEHKVLVPHDESGTLTHIEKEGDFTIVDDLYRVKKNGEEKSFCMEQEWPITKIRPFKERISPTKPLFTGIRAIDLLFPIAMGGSFAVPGGFGTGKTVIQQSIAKYCNADIVVYIGCGEPGNEIAHILKEFSEIYDPIKKRPLLERVILIANTSNMPVSAREASLFSGITIAEYYRDMGYDVAVIADSTSRWAESLREISSLLEEMPAEEGYPAYLSSKISSFYERAGVVKNLGRSLSNGERTGSITVIGSVSPPGGDFNEPVTAATKRVVQGIWALDPKLAYMKHYPAIDWLNSYSNYPDAIMEWWNERDIKWDELKLDWYECRKQVDEILSKEHTFKMISQLTDKSELNAYQEFILFIAEMIKEGVLIQNFYDEIDKYTDPRKLLGIIKVILLIYQHGKYLLERGLWPKEVIGEQLISTILKIKNSIQNKNFEEIEDIKNTIVQKIKGRNF